MILKLSRLLHGLCALFNLAYVYTPLHMWSLGLVIVQYITMPLLVISAIFMVKAKKSYS
jgi:hypothetical protein